MRIKLDEHMPTALMRALMALGHDVDTVPREGLAGTDDPVVWSAAQASGRFLITQDMDFSDVRRFQPGTHEGILLVRLKEHGRMALTARVRAAFEAEPVESWRRCFVVLSEHKVRVRRPLGL